MKDEILKTVGLTKAFGAVKALSEVDFSLKSGEIRAIIGTNGAGKSTLVNVLYGLEQPDDGEIYIDGELHPI